MEGVEQTRDKLIRRYKNERESSSGEDDSFNGTYKRVKYQHIKDQLSILSLGHLSPSTITPNNLQGLLIEIKDKLPKYLELTNDPKENLWFFYRFLTCSTILYDSRILVVISIPLLDSNNKFEIYQAFNLPMPMQKNHTNIGIIIFILCKYRKKLPCSAKRGSGCKMQNVAPKYDRVSQLVSAKTEGDVNTSRDVPSAPMLDNSKEEVANNLYPLLKLAEQTVLVLVQGDVWQGPFENKTAQTNDVMLEVVNVTTENKVFDFTNKVCELAAESVDGFVLFVDCSTAMVLEKQKIFTSVPTVVVIRDFCHVTSTRMIQLRPDCTYSNTLLADVAAYKLWRNVLLYSDHTYSSLCLTDLLKQLSLNSVSTRMVRTNNYAGPLQYVHYIERHAPDGIFVVTATDTMEDIISQDSAIYLSDAMKAMLEIFSEVVLTTNVTALEPIDCRQKSTPRNRTLAMEVFKICSTENSLTDSWKYMGNWSQDDGISLMTSRLFGNEFIDFNNATLKVAALPLDPFVFFNNDDNNRTTHSGFCIDILDQLALKFNFNYEIVSPSDNAYGSLEDDGTWNGMVGMDVYGFSQFVPCRPVFIRDYRVLLAMLMRASILILFSFNSAFIKPRCVVSSDGQTGVLPSVQFESDLFIFVGLLRMTALVLVGFIVTLDCLA
ncbi:unnamed protein product [Mytilus coruscus]|uniref:Ionotropic glutamate receptor L-glutamate and glycine-binding domain-containing protein n=1 Tax=Mytilus coruscus TaxID=42192 RepID=A0A6J8AE45_MYTCO|nr:unnamed protein product [Mytilus coruscus]